MPRKAADGGTYVLLIGHNTQYKTAYVKWKAEVAIEKECRLIGRNLDNWRVQNSYTCPSVFMNAERYSCLSLRSSSRMRSSPRTGGGRPPRHDHYYFHDPIYRQLGYTIDGYIATLPPKPPPFLNDGVCNFFADPSGRGLGLDVGRVLRQRERGPGGWLLHPL